jgi:cytosine/adenosine deaminase-related metal-dependent hydrolase
VDRHRNRRHAPQSRRRHAQLRPEGSDHPAAGYHDVFDRCCHRLGTAATAGSLETGKVADFIVLDRDPFAGPPTAIHDTRVLETWVGGTRIYQRTKP